MSNDTESVVDALVASLKEFEAADAAEGGCADILRIEMTYFGDPGVIPPDFMPAFMVQPVQDAPGAQFTETLGYEIRDINILITLIVDARLYFDASADEADGDRKMVQVMDALSKWLRVRARRRLDGLAGVRDVSVQRTDYFVQVRGTTISKSAQLTVAVNMQRPRQR